MKIIVQITVLFSAVFFHYSYAQIQGTVFSTDGSPIPDVSIIYKLDVVAQTNAEGAFTLSEEFTPPLEVTLSHSDYLNEVFSLLKTDNVITLEPKNSLSQLSEVVLTSQQNKESAFLGNTDVISEESILSFSPENVVNAINQTPGVYVQSGAINTNRITIRGVGSRTLYGTNKIRAYFNGIPVTNGIGETALDIYNADNLASIEIIKGPKATKYGSNLGGILLFETKDEQENSVANSFTVGLFGLLKNMTLMNYSEEKLQLQFTYDHLQTDGFRDNSFYNRNSYNLTAKHVINNKSAISVLLQQLDNFAQIPSSIGKTAFEEDPTQAAFTWGSAKGYEDNRQTLAGFSYSYNYTENIQQTTSIFYNYLDHYEHRPFNILDENTNGFGIRSVIDASYSIFGKKATAFVGTELYKDEYAWKTFENNYEENNGNGSLQGTLLSDNEEYRSRWDVFASTTLAISPTLDVQVGLDFNKTKYEFQDQFNSGSENRSASRDFDPLLAPSFTLRYEPSSWVQLIANVSRGFNHPSLEETVTPEGLINPEIGPETGWNYEVGSTLQLLNNQLILNGTAYVMDIDNLLVAERVGDDQYIGRNAGRTLHRGFEFSGRYEKDIFLNFSIAPFANVSFNFHTFETFVDEDNDYSGNDLTGVPNKKLNAGFSLKHNSGAYLFYNHLYVGSQPMNDANTLYSDSYSVSTLKMGYRRIFGKVATNIHLGVDNLFDERYASSILINAVGFGNSEPRFYYPGKPINYFGGVSVTYTL